MTARAEYVARLLGPLHRTPAQNDRAAAFMPSNIALVKYWGKRPGPLNLPLVSSLSYTLDGYGTETEISLAKADTVEMNGAVLAPGDEAAIKIKDYLDLFRAEGEHYRVVTRNNIPTAAGVASSASGFAALLSAIIKMKGWDVPLREQSMLARLGSGSAARSFWPGLVLWHKGDRADGMDCFAEQVLAAPAFRMAVLLLDKGKKEWSSRRAMEISLATSPLAAAWPEEQRRHLDAALAAQDFAALGPVVEANAVLLHSLLERSSPSIVFDRPETALWKKKIRAWREEGLPVYFTQDAGPNLKLIFPFEIKDKIHGKLTAEGIDYFSV